MNTTTGEFAPIDSLTMPHDQSDRLSEWLLMGRSAGTAAFLAAASLSGAILTNDIAPQYSQQTIEQETNIDNLNGSATASTTPISGTLTVREFLEPLHSIVVTPDYFSSQLPFSVSGEDNGFTNIDSPDDVPEGTPGESEEEIARANNGDYGDDSHGIPFELYDIRPTGNYGTSPDFNRLLTCTKPESYDTPAIAKKLAKFCIKYAQRGVDGKGMDVAFINFSSKSNKTVTRIMNKFESTLKRVTGGLYKADTHKVKPSVEAKSAFTAMVTRRGGEQCLPTASGVLAANKMREVMPDELRSFPQVVVLSDLKACSSSTLPESISGVANFNGVDILEIGRQPNKEVSNTLVHETGHNLGIDHYGSHVPDDAELVEGKQSYFVIPERFSSDGTLDMNEYLAQSTMRPYDLDKRNVMGYAVPETVSLTKFQQHWFAWANRIMGKHKSEKLLLNLGPEGVSMYANKLSTKPVVIKLAETYSTGISDHGEDVLYTDMSLTPVGSKVRLGGIKKKVVGAVDLELMNSQDGRSVTAGRLMLKFGKTIIKYSSTGQTLVVTTDKKGLFSVRDITQDKAE